MRFQFRDKALAGKIRRGIENKRKRIDRPLILMHVCGTHQDTLVRHGLNSLLAGMEIDVREGPGCPVCVTTTREIEEALALARAGKIIATYGDMLRTPGETGSLETIRNEGLDVDVVFSVDDALRLAKEKDEDVVFLGVGFETTMPSTAATLAHAPPDNFSVLNIHRYTPPAVVGIAELGKVELDGLILPGHVCTITGKGPWEPVSFQAGIPQVIAGFEPIDMLVAIYMLLSQVAESRAEVEIQYKRTVRPDGNPKALEIMDQVFQPVDREWRGFPSLAKSGAEIRKNYEDWDARKAHPDILAPLADRTFRDPKGCRCGEVIRGELHSWECPLFGRMCAPDNPVGPCMVSVEGACAIEYKYGTHQEHSD